MKKAANFCSFFICRFKFFILHLHTCPGNPGTVPTTLSRGGESFKRLLRITPFSAMFFYARPAKRHADLRPPIRRSSASQPDDPQVGRSAGRRIPATAAAAKALSPTFRKDFTFCRLLLYLRSDFHNRHHDSAHILSHRRDLLPANRHRTGRGRYPQRNLHGRLFRKHAGRRRARTRHEGRRCRRAARRHRLPRQGHVMPRPVGKSAETGALAPRCNIGNEFCTRQVHKIKTGNLCILSGTSCSVWRPDGSPTSSSRATAQGLSSTLS